MEDREIISLYWSRDERAISETSRKYGGLCFRIAKNILTAAADAEECVNDTYFRAWNSMPPQNPVKLGAWLGRVVRNIAISLWQKNHAQKRYCGVEAVLDELEECIPSSNTVERELDDKELSVFIDRWLSTLEEDDRAIFVWRYWYGESVAEIAKKRGTDPAKIANRMFRLRKRLRGELEKEGYSI